MSTSLVNKERFIPSRLSNLAVWLDGADSTTIGLSGNTTQVLTWKDKSSYSNNFSVQPVPPPIPPIFSVSRVIAGSDTITLSPSFAAVVTASLSGAAGGGAVAAGGPGGFAGYTFANVPAGTTIQYTVGPFGTPGNGSGGGGGATTMTIGNDTIVAGGGGSSVKLNPGNAASTPFGGAINSDGSAGFYFNDSRAVTPPPPGFSYTVGGGAAISANGSIRIAPSPSNYTTPGTGTFVVAAPISATITVYGGAGGGDGGKLGGKVVYTGAMPVGTYTWNVGNKGIGSTGGAGYYPGNNGMISYPADLPFGGGVNAPGDAGVVFTNQSTSQSELGFTKTPGGGGSISTNGSVVITLPPPVTNEYASGTSTWKSPSYTSSVVIEVRGAGAGGGSSGVGIGGNSGGSGGRAYLTVVGVPPGTSFNYTVGTGGQGSQASGPQDNDSITGGSGGFPDGQSGTTNSGGGGGGGSSAVSYIDPTAGVVVVQAGGGGGGGAWAYYSGGKPVDGLAGGDGGYPSSGGGKGGGVSDTPQQGGDGSYVLNGAVNRLWPVYFSGYNGAGGAGGPGSYQQQGVNTGFAGGDGYISFNAYPLGIPANFDTPINASFIPTETSTYIITVNGAGGGGGSGGRGVYTTTLTRNVGYPLTVGASGSGGNAGSASTFGGLTVGVNTDVILRAGGGGGGSAGGGGGGSSALVFPNGAIIGGGGGLGDGGTSGGRGGGSDVNGANGGSTLNGGNGGGFSSGTLPAGSSVSTLGAGTAGSPGSIVISYSPVDIITPVSVISDTFSTPVAGTYTITVNGAGGGGGRGGQGIYTVTLGAGVTYPYYLGAGGTGALPGGPTYIGIFPVETKSATLEAGGGGSSQDVPSAGALGGGGIAYGGAGGQPGVNGYNGFVNSGFGGRGGSTTLTGVTSIVGGGSQGDKGSIYFTVSYTTPVSSPSLTVYSNSGVLFPSGYSAISSKLSGLGSTKTMIAVYQCSGAAASMNIGIGTSVPGGSFGICQADRILYSPYQYGNGYDLTFTPSNYTAKSYAFASYNTAPYAITGMPGFNDASMNSVAFKNLITDTSLIIGRQLTGYPTGDFILHELIATSNALTSSDRQDVEGYLAAKWGLSAQLPSSHPYKNFEPSGDQWIPPTLPTTISGLVSWLDMTYPGQTTTNVVDRVGGSFDNRGPSPILSNINNLPSLYLPGYGSALYRDINQTAVGSVLLVVTFSDSDTVSHPIIAFNGSPALAYVNGTLILGNTNGYYITSPDPISVTTDLGPNLVFFSWENSNYYLSVNGGTPVVGSYAAPARSDKFYIGLYTGGVGQSPQMNFGELVVYNQYFEQSERQLLEGYLAWKWSIVNKLPSSHPFSKDSPNGATVSETGALNIPAQIASLTTWLDAADSASIVLTGGLNVSGWSDKSATLDVFTSTNRPTYSTTDNIVGGPPRPGVYFSDKNFLRGTVNAAISSGVGTCFMVASIITNAAVFMGAYVDGIPQAGNSFGLISDSLSVTSPFQGSQREYRNPLPSYPPRPTLIFASIDVYDSRAGGGSWAFQTPEIIIENILVGGRLVQTSWTPFTPTPSPWNLGYLGTYPAFQNFYLHEFLCFSEFFTESQRFVVEGYLAWKWGIQSQLPLGHPYKDARPQSA